MIFISFSKKPGGRRQKRGMTPEKMFRLTEFRNWQSNRVVKEFDKTETGSKLKASIHGHLSELARLKREKATGWELKQKLVTDTIAAKRIEYIEELIKFLRNQKGVYKSTIELFERELQQFRAGKAGLVE